MADPYDLTKLSPEAFENLVNFLALKTLGSGTTGFGPGADGGRDGFFEGKAPYPSDAEHWDGIWYIQSKFHKPSLGHSPQKWLIEQVKKEIEAFNKDKSDRQWPDNWIIATNIDPSGKPETGSFDAIHKLLKKSTKGKKVNLHIWGGRKILDLLVQYPSVAESYGHFLTPGHVISALYNQLNESRASIDEVIRFFVVTQFTDHLFTKLDQAGSSSDVRPAVHDLFIDLPFKSSTGQRGEGILSQLCIASAQSLRYSTRSKFPASWHQWSMRLKRARVSLIKGGPGQGKSTVGQYLCQIHRAALILENDSLKATTSIQASAKAVRAAAQDKNFWPQSPRIPIQIELKEFAHWYSQRKESETKNFLAYLAETIAKKIGTKVLPKTIKNAIAKGSWIIVFDGLDEVPNDYKDEVANEALYFINDLLVEIDADALAFCTSRPQGYSGQFSGLDGPVVDLELLPVAIAMRCATRLLQFGRSGDEAAKSIEVLAAAIQSPNIQELMTTPLQSHIMAVVVRDGGRPPERRWQLFNSFYLVMKKRESQKNFPNQRIAKLLREEDRLLKSVHMRLGFVLHARAERSEGAQTTLNKEEFRLLVRDVVKELVDQDIDETVSCVMEATTERLVLVSTPESGDHVRFDIRQLQEFFAAEFLYAGVSAEELSDRIETIGVDAHWREVMHFLLSALIENQRTTDVAVAVQVLRVLDDGSENDVNALYCRRMARAGLLAGRLLTEGVLEQDQRDRQQIKPLLDPLSAIFDLQSIQPLVRVASTRSRLWLINLLLDRVSAASPHQYVGALYLLGWLAPNDGANDDSLRAAFNELSKNSQERLIVLWTPHDRDYYFGKDKTNNKHHGEPLSNWVFALAIETLNSSKWTNFEAHIIGCLIRICRSSRSQFLFVCEKLGIEPSIAHAIFTCFDEPSSRPGQYGSQSDLNYGSISAEQYSENWKSGGIPNRLLGIEGGKCAKASGGAIRLLFSCIWFAEERTNLAIREIVQIAESAGGDKVAALPEDLLALVPFEGQHTLAPFYVGFMRRNYEHTGEEIIKAAEERGIQPLYSSLMIAPSNSTGSTTVDWSLLATKLPNIAVTLAMRADDDFVSVGQPKFVPELVLLFEKFPALASPHVLKWGSLIAYNQVGILHGLISASENLLYSDVLYFQTTLKPFKLELPNDAKVLGLLAPALIYWLFNRSNTKSSEGVGKVLQNALTGYGLDVATLRTIADSDAYLINSRAGALALFWIARHFTSSSGSISKLDLRRERALYSELVNSLNEKWFTLALVRGVLNFATELERESLDFVTYLMERCSDGSGPFEELVELITVWRERSLAPVQGRQVLESWLGYNFETPAYLHSAERNRRKN